MVELAPGISMRFVWIPKGSYMKGKDTGSLYLVDYAKTSIDKGFWMGCMEVSNEQYKALCPEHDSRILASNGKIIQRLVIRRMNLSSLSFVFHGLKLWNSVRR